MNKRAAYNRDLVMLHLRIPKERYAELVYAEGVRYLSTYMADDPDGRRVLEGLPSYWQWWEGQWARMDAEFVRRSELETTGPSADRWQRAKLNELYAVIHDGTTLGELRVSKRVMREAIACKNEQP